MAAGRLARPALPPPLPAQQMPDQQGGGLTGARGARARQGRQRGLPPQQHTPVSGDCQPAGDKRGSGPPKRGREGRGWDGRELVPLGTLGWAKSHRGIAAAFCPRWGCCDPLALECHGGSCPVPAQPGGDTLPPSSWQQQRPDPSPRSPATANQAAKLRLIPLQRHSPPSPSVRGTSRGN